MISTRCTLCVLSLLLSMAGLCFGQAFTANVTGVVTDSTGSVVPGATVTIRNIATSETRRSTSTAEGRYTFSQLQPGDYELEIGSTGFKTKTHTGIKLLASQNAEINVSLEVGQISERVEVSAQAVQLDTQSADQAITITTNEVLKLPQNMRNPLVLVHAQAGIVAAETGIPRNTEDQNYVRFNMNGGRTESSLVMLDGISATTGTGWNGGFYGLSVDSTQEVQIIRNSYDAQFGKSGGGVVNIVSRGGSEQFHGTVFEFLRNSALDANTWENNRNRRAKPNFQRNQFGGNFSGPLWRSKRLFFFAGYEGLRQGTPETRIATVPTELERQGDFSRTFNGNGTLQVIYDPFSTRPNPSGSGYIRTAFPENRIPRERWDPVGSKILSLMPKPNVPGLPVTGAENFVASGTRVARTDRYDLRGDWARSEKHTMYLRFSRAPVQENRSPIFYEVADTSSTSVEPRHHATFSNTFVPNPTWVINVLAGHGSWREQRFPNVTGNGTLWGMPQSLVGQFQAEAIPQINVAGYSTLGYQQILANHSRNENVQVNVTKELGEHSLRFGWTGEWAKLNGGWVSSASFSFNRGMTSGPTAAADSASTGNSLASLLLGTGSGGSAAWVSLPTMNKSYYGAYFQDNWRATRRLTLNLGLRWEVQKAPTDRFDRYSTFQYDVRHPLSAPTGLNLRGGLVWTGENGAWDTDWLDLAPRIGLAFKMTDSLVVRAGYGIMYPAVLGQGHITGFSSTTPWVTSVGGDAINPLNRISDPMPGNLIPIVGSSLGLMTDAGRSVTAVPRDWPSGYVQNYSLDFQYDLGQSAVIEIGYSGNQGRKLPWGIGINDNQLHPDYLKLGAALDQPVPNPFYGHIAAGPLSGKTVPYHRLLRPYPQFDGVFRSGGVPGASSSYNALVGKMTKRFSAGLTLLASYQWSKAIDNSSETQAWEGGGDGFRNYADLSIERSISAHDLPHSFVTTLIYELPVGKGKAFGSGMHPVAQAILGNWETATIIRLQSGLPVRMTAPSTISNYGFGVQLPNLTSAEDLKVEKRTPERWFNTAAFSAPPPYSVGTAPRRITELRDGETKHADVSLMKNFNVTERLRAQFRAEFFNITNTPEFGRPNTSFGSQTFGMVTSTANVPPRNIQFGLKLDF